MDFGELTERVERLEARHGSGRQCLALHQQALAIAHHLCTKYRVRLSVCARYGCYLYYFIRNSLVFLLTAYLLECGFQPCCKPYLKGTRGELHRWSNFGRAIILGVFINAVAGLVVHTCKLQPVLLWREKAVLLALPSNLGIPIPASYPVFRTKWREIN